MNFTIKQQVYNGVYDGVHLFNIRKNSTNRFLLYFFQRTEHKPLNANDGKISGKIGDHFCKTQCGLDAVNVRIRQGLGCDKAAQDDGRIVLLAIWDVTEYAQHFGKNKPHGKIDVNFHKALPVHYHYRDDNFHFNDIEEIKTLITEEANRFSSPRQKKTLQLSPFQHDLLVAAISAFKNKQYRQLWGAAARSGKTSTVLALVKETGLPVVVFASYVTNSLNSMRQDAANFAQFHDMLVVDTRIDGYQDLINKGVAAGKQVIAMLSMCGGGNRQERIDFLFGLKTQHTLVIDEADFGVHQPNQTDPLKAAIADDELVIIMTGTNPVRATSTWDIDFQYHISNQDMQVARKLYVEHKYPQKPSRLKFFKKDYEILATIVPVQFFQMTLKKLQELAKIMYPGAFTNDDLWGSWIKWMKDPLKASGPLGTFFQAVFEGKWSIDEVNTAYQFKLNPNEQRVVIVWLPYDTEVTSIEQAAGIAQSSLKNWDVIHLSGAVRLPDGRKLTGEKAENYIKGRIADAKQNNNRNVMIISAIMGARSFGVKEITEVYLCFDEGDAGATEQRIARALTPFFDGTNKLARIVSCSFDPNRDDKFDSMLLECASRTKALYGATLVDAIRLVMSTTDFFIMTQNGPAPYEPSEYLAAMIARKSTAKVFGKVFRIENIPTDLLESIANISGKIGKQTKQEVAERGKTFLEALKKGKNGTATPAQDKIWRDIRNGLVYIASNIDWIMCFGRRGASLVECLNILDKETQRTQDGLAEDYGIPYADLSRLLRSDVGSHDLLELGSFAGTGTASNRQKFSIDPLVMEMLAIIPEKDWQSSTKTFADLAMAGGQFNVGLVRMLRTYGHSDENIRSRVFGFDTCKHRILAAKYHCPDLIGTFEVKTIEELMKMTQKFDVIVGNPPYQDPTAINSKKLWTRFLMKSTELVAANGYVALITPQACMKPGKWFDLLSKKFALLWVNTVIKKHFGNVGSTFCAFVIQNTTPNQFALVDNQQFDLSIGLIPKIVDTDSISILQKVLKTDKKFSLEWRHDFDSRNECYGQDKTKRTQKTQTRKYPIFHTNTKILYSSEKHPYQNLSKVMVTDSGYWKPFYDEEMGGTQAVFIRLVSSRAEGKRVVKILDSKLFHFIIQSIKRGGFTTDRIVRLLPYHDTNLDWTDEKIYKHFNLTKKEIAYIESYLA